jgi:UDP-GlcNAc:undecaprenyl-phosphate/decaprenyl-phosphate GlcNAc-1-phosphate transferase
MGIFTVSFSPVLQTLPWLLTIGMAAFAVGLVATFMTRFVAQRVGFVAKPRAERWHSRPTALAGGVGIFAAFVAPALVAGGHLRVHLLAGAGAMFLLGLVDDILHLKPYAKLVGQFAVAALTVVTGSILPWTGVPLLNQAISVFWIIGITNALNLLDNMDGLAGGVACLASIFQAIFFLLQRQMPEAACSIALAGATAGFLVFNWKPASIFMGDCGALFLGYTLATLAMEHGYGRSRGLLATVAAPVLVMLVPIFDTTFVTLLRLVRGRPVSQGGRDHTSHRLVTLGVSEATAVRTLLSIGALGGTIAVLARLGITAGVWIGVPLLAIALAFLGIHLARTDRPEQVPQRNLLLSVAAFGYRRRLFEVVVDAVNAMVALVAAFLLRFDGSIPREIASDLGRVFLVIVATKLVVLYLAHAYDGVWRYAAMRDLMNLARNAALGSLCSFVVVGISIRFGTLSRGALIIDGLLFAILVMASRISFRVLRVLLGGAQERAGAVRVLLWGAGDLGEQLARRLLDNPEEGLVPVAFVDDDPLKIGRMIHGLPVSGNAKEIPILLGAGFADIAIVTTSRISDERAASIAHLAGPKRIRRLRFVLEDVTARSPASAPAALPPS